MVGSERKLEFGIMCERGREKARKKGEEREEVEAWKNWWGCESKRELKFGKIQERERETAEESWDMKNRRKRKGKIEWELRHGKFEKERARSSKREL